MTVGEGAFRVAHCLRQCIGSRQKLGIAEAMATGVVGAWRLRCLLASVPGSGV